MRGEAALSRLFPSTGRRWCAGGGARGAAGLAADEPVERRSSQRAFDTDAAARLRRTHARRGARWRPSEAARGAVPLRPSGPFFSRAVPLRPPAAFRAAAACRRAWPAALTSGCLPRSGRLLPRVAGCRIACSRWGPLRQARAATIKTPNTGKCPTEGPPGRPIPKARVRDALQLENARST